MNPIVIGQFWVKSGRQYTPLAHKNRFVEVAGEDDDTISVEAASVTAFTEGEGVLLIVLAHTVEAVA